MDLSTTSSSSGHSPVKAIWLALLLAVLYTQHASANAETLTLAIPGEVLGKTSQGWYALSLEGDSLVVDRTAGPITSNTLNVSDEYADQLLVGKPLRTRPISSGYSVKAPPGALVLMRIDAGNGSPRQVTPGRYLSSVPADVLREGWSAVGVIGERKWNFLAEHKKRPDGRLLAGSVEIVAELGRPSTHRRVLLPPAIGMAFAKQELLWLGDLNSDGEPDLFLRRTWVTGEMDYVLVVSPMLATAYYDPDHPDVYSTSLDGNSYTWHKDRTEPTPIKFIRSGQFSIGEEEWGRHLPDGEVQVPKEIADRQFKLSGESIRFSLEHLPRLQGGKESSAFHQTWAGTVLVRVTFRGKSQVLMQASQPSEGLFSLSVGIVDGRPSVKIDHQPHYNNSFTRYWMYDETAMRFRRLRDEFYQGC